MSSHALAEWRSASKRALDSIAAAHRAVGGKGPGRRYATQEINHAYAVMVASQFQKFCRDLHTEAVAHLVASAQPPHLASVLRKLLLENRHLDKGNPNPGNLGSDFGRLGLDFWTEISNQSNRNDARKKKLEHLCDWRNAIAHQDFRPRNALVPPPPLRLPTVRSWRSACDALAGHFDRCLGRHVAVVTGHRPW